MRWLYGLLLLLPAASFAGPFDGVWKARADSMKTTGKPDVYELKDGMFSCTSCVPAYTIKADGSEQSVPGHDYIDKETVRVLGPSSVEFTGKKGGKLTFKSVVTLSPDGKTLTSRFTNFTGEKPYEGSYTQTRLAAGAPGSHALSGTWQQGSISDVADTGLLVKLESTPNGMKMTWNGQVTDAKFDGKQYPTQGDPGKTMVTLKRVSDSQIEETDRRQGKVFDVIVWKLSPDGKSISFEDTDPVHGTKTTWISEKQP